MVSKKRLLSEQPLQSVWNEELIEKISSNTKHTSKIWNYLIHHPDKEIADIPFGEWSIANTLKAALSSDFVKFTTKIVEKIESERGDTTKLLIELQDGHRIETVVIR